MKFSELSKSRLSGCHMDLQILFKHVILEYDCMVVCGQRGEAEQNEAFAKGNSKLQYPNSKHNSLPSIAVDVVPYENGPDWSKLQSAHFAGYVKGIADQLLRIGTIKSKIRCGVDWDKDNDIDDTKFWDGGHFEIINT
jgi:peptidoglycan L-alanyl-D-glutamate endopeptidase CwlK